MLSITICLFLSYLAGSVPSSIIISKLARGIDIRKYGSGNAGFTNVARVMGWKPAVVVLVMDVFKGFAATYWLPGPFVEASGLTPEVLGILAGAAAVIGHIWTIFASFKGGKGVLTALGMFLALLPIPTIACAAIAGLLMYIFRYVSLGSITGGLCLPVITGAEKYLLGAPVPDILFIFSILIAALIIFTHRSNVRRLLSGTETRIGRIKTDISR